MLLLMFRVAGDRFAVDAARVREVVPRVDARPVPHAPQFLSGLIDYRGRVVPVVDLGLRLGNRPCRPVLSTRIIVVDASAETHSGKALLGLIAEEVNDVSAVEADQFIFPPTPLEQAPYLGSIVRVDGELVQMIDAGKVLAGTPVAASFGGLAEAR